MDSTASGAINTGDELIAIIQSPNAATSSADGRLRAAMASSTAFRHRAVQQVIDLRAESPWHLALQDAPGLKANLEHK